MYCASKNSKQKLYHSTECVHYKRIKKKNRIWLNNKAEAVSSGYIICPCCSKLKRMYDAEYSEIWKYVIKTGYKVWYEPEVIHIKTQMAYWKIVLEGKKNNPHLYHESLTQIYRFRPVVNGKLDLEYHPQLGIYSENIMGYLNYIDGHDNWRKEQEDSYKSMPRNTRKKRAAYKKAKELAIKRSIKRVLNAIEKMEAES